MSQMSIPVDETLAHGLSSFQIDDQLFGVPVRVVREINGHLEITKVPRALSYVAGIVNLRGQLVTVLDLGERLGLGKRTIGRDSRLVVLKTNEELAGLQAKELTTADDKIGLLVDQISDVVMPSSDDLEGPPANMDSGLKPLVAGVCKAGDRTVTVLEPRQLLDHSYDPAHARGSQLENGEIR